MTRAMSVRRTRANVAPREVLPLITARIGVRVQDAVFRGFDPFEDPEGALKNLHRIELEVLKIQDSEERSRGVESLNDAVPLLMEFIKDQAKICTVFGDIETTELIRHGTPIEKMEISVASLLFVEKDGKSMMLSFWGSADSGLGASLDFFIHALNHANKLVFYNANFDLRVASKGDKKLIKEWWRKTHDPYYILREEFEYDAVLKLDRLLSDNGIETKKATGIEAVKMFKEERFEELQEYNVYDVKALRALVELEKVKLSNGVLTDIVKL